MREVYCEIYIEQNIKTLKTLFIWRSYPKQMVGKNLCKAKYNDRKRSSKTENENAQKTCNLCDAISTALPKFEKHNQGQIAH